MDKKAEDTGGLDFDLGLSSAERNPAPAPAAPATSACLTST